MMDKKIHIFRPRKEVNAEMLVSIEASRAEFESCLADIHRIGYNVEILQDDPLLINLFPPFDYSKGPEESHAGAGKGFIELLEILKKIQLVFSVDFETVSFAFVRMTKEEKADKSVMDNPFYSR